MILSNIKMVSGKSVSNKCRSTVEFTPTKVSFYPLNMPITIFLKPMLRSFGLQLDSHLTWKTRINVLLNTLRTMFYHENTILYTKTLETLNVIYVTHFHTLTKHGIIFWGTSLLCIRFTCFKKE
jgi:hypothetical protein